MILSFLNDHRRDMATADIVAVKIIDIDQSDTVSPRNADSYSEFLKEIGALKILSESKARNINHVIDALPVDQTMWMDIVVLWRRECCYIGKYPFHGSV